MASSVVTIEELTGTKRRLDLIGGGLPSKGASWGGTTVVATQWNPGNPEGTQHVLSPQFDPSPWEGMWRTTILVASPCQFTASEGGSPQTISTASTLAEIVESIRLGGQLLRVTFVNRQGERELKLTRVGRLTMFTVRPETLDDIAWSMEYTWLGTGDQVRSAPSPQDDVLAAARSTIVVQNAIVAGIETDRIRASRGTKNQATRFNLGDVESLAGAPLAIVDSFARAATNLSSELQDIGKIILKVRDVPAAIAGRALSAASNGVGVATDFLDKISQKGPETIALRNDAAFFAQSLAYFSDSQRRAHLMVRSNLLLAAQAKQRRAALGSSSASGSQSASSALRQADVQAVYLPKTGDTFSGIAKKFYQNPDLGYEIAKVNGYPAYTIVPPRRIALVIPTRAVIDARVRAGI